MTYPILNMAQILCAAPLNGTDTRRFVRSSRLPKLADGPDVVAVIADGGNRPVARWVRNPQSRKLECVWSAQTAGTEL
ncbi:MAG: hypothetical protein LBI75_00955 [Brucellaceae bacterium]|jgi:hypothetical protein|nr:hypothetical protein [Brucellaceae bacterium]